MTNGMRSLKTEARNIQKNKGILYTEAFEQAKSDLEGSLNGRFAEVLKTASSTIVNSLALQEKDKMVILLDVAFEELTLKITEQGISKDSVIEYLETSTEKSLEISEDEGEEVIDFVAHVQEIASVAVKLVDSVPLSK